MDLKQFFADYRKKIELIILTDDEVKEALWEKKLKKYFHERTKDYWQCAEQIKKKI